MSKKKKAIAIVICLFLLVAFAIVYIFSELYNEDEIKNPIITDAIKFKNEYENLNDKIINEQKIRTLEIPEENPMVYITAEDLAKKVDNKESFIVYFGFDNCSWCRSVIIALIDSANQNKVDKVYYVDIKNIRDKYELNDKNEAIKTVEGSNGYYALLERFDTVLKEYSPLVYVVKGKIKNVNIPEKRIYAPNVILVKNGKAESLESGIPEKLTDPYMELTTSMKKDSLNKFNCLFESLNSDDNTCTCSSELC